MDVRVEVYATGKTVTALVPCPTGASPRQGSDRMQLAPEERRAQAASPQQWADLGACPLVGGSPAGRAGNRRQGTVTRP